MRGGRGGVIGEGGRRVAGHCVTAEGGDLSASLQWWKSVLLTVVQWVNRVTVERGPGGFWDGGRQIVEPSEKAGEKAGPRRCRTEKWGRTTGPGHTAVGTFRSSHTTQVVHPPFLTPESSAGSQTSISLFTTHLPQFPPPKKHDCYLSIMLTIV